jgi:hypothetical protein
MDYRPNGKHKTIKYLQGNTGENLDGLWLSYDFLDFNKN